MVATSSSRRSRRNRRWLVLVLFALVAAVALIVRNQTHNPPAEAVEAAGAAPVPSDRPSGTSPGPRPVVPAVPVPALGTPISVGADALRQHADAGDANAACRLGMELLRCQQVPDEHTEFFFQNSEQQEKHWRDSGNLRMAERVAAGRRKALEIHAACREIPTATRDRAHHYIRQAALAGEPEAMLRYASGESLGLMGRFDRLNSPELEAWRREAPAILQRALAAGRPEAIALLAEAFRPGDDATTSIIGWLIPNDPVQAHAYSLLQRQLSGGITPPGQRLVTGLDDAGIARAETLAKDLRLRYFNGIAVDPERVVLGLPPLTDTHGYSKHSAVADGFCRSDVAGVEP